MFILSVRGVKVRLENDFTLDFCLFDSRCVIKLREIPVREILVPNLKFFTTYRSETLILRSVSWIGSYMTSTKPYH